MKRVYFADEVGKPLRQVLICDKDDEITPPKKQTDNKNKLFYLIIISLILYIIFA